MSGQVTAAVPAPGVVVFEIGNHSCVCSHSMSGSSRGVVDEHGVGSVVSGGCGGGEVTAAAAAPVVGA